MVAVLEDFKRLRELMDEGMPGRDWNIATAMVIEGVAGFQLMGDWAKGEFTAAGMTAGDDYQLCLIIAPEALAALPAPVREQLTVIGRIVPEPGLTLAGAPAGYQTQGYDHFGRSD